jgi:hypothetical protein
MGDFASWYQSGGALMHPILLGGLMSGAISIAALATRKRPVPLVALLCALGVVALGAFGTWTGFVEVDRALVHVPADQFEAARAKGEEIAVIPLTFASMLGGPALLAALVAMVFSKPASRDPGR